MASILVGTTAAAAASAAGGAAAGTAAAGTAAAAGAASAAAATGAAAASTFGIAEGLMAAGLVAGLGGTAMSMKSQHDMAESQAAYSEEVGAYNAAATKDQYRKLISTQKASYGASGVQLDDGGTPSDVLAETMVDMELDAMQVYYGGQAKGTAFKNQARANSTGALFNGLAQAGTGAYSLLR